MDGQSINENAACYLVLNKHSAWMAIDVTQVPLK